MITDLIGNELAPSEDDPCVLKLLDTIDAEFEPITLDIEPEPNAEQLDCFIVVENKVKKSGGKRILGWQVWKTRFLMRSDPNWNMKNDAGAARLQCRRRLAAAGLLRGFRNPFHCFLKTPF